MFTDECAVQLDHRGWLCFHKQKRSQALKKRPKHPAKVHIWDGISMRGATHLVMFTGNMNTVKYRQILGNRLSAIYQSMFSRWCPFAAGQQS